MWGKFCWPWDVGGFSCCSLSKLQVSRTTFYDRQMDKRQTDVRSQLWQLFITLLKCDEFPLNPVVIGSQLRSVIFCKIHDPRESICIDRQPPQDTFVDTCDKQRGDGYCKTRYFDIIQDDLCDRTCGLCEIRNLGMRSTFVFATVIPYNPRFLIGLCRIQMLSSDWFSKTFWGGIRIFIHCTPCIISQEVSYSNNMYIMHWGSSNERSGPSGFPWGCPDTINSDVIFYAYQIVILLWKLLFIYTTAVHMKVHIHVSGVTV